jgi:mRNA interferase RelE/StbE
MPYTVRISSAAGRQFKKLPPDIQQRLRPQIGSLAKNPRPSGVSKVKGGDNQYKIRVGDYRVLYEIHDRQLLVLVVKAGHRRDVYR